MGYYDESRLKSQIDDLEKTVRQLRPVAETFTSVKSNIQLRTGIDRAALDEAFRLMQADDNELITAQLKQLMATVRLVYAEEIAAEQQRVKDNEREMERRHAAELAAEAARLKSLAAVDQDNRKIVKENLRLMRTHAEKTVAKFRSPVPRDDINQGDFTEITELCVNSRGKLQMDRVGFLWSDVILRGGIPEIKYDDELYKFYLKHFVAGIQELVEIPDSLYYGRMSHYYMGMIRGGGRDKRYFVKEL